MFDFFVIGHISLDENIYPQNKEKNVGGAILYSSSVYSSLDYKVAVLTKLCKTDYDCIQKLNIPENNIFLVSSPKTTSIRNIYLDESRERRISTALAIAQPFLITEIPKDLKARVIHFASLIYGEYQSELVKFFSDKGKIAVDVQGFLRNVGEDGKLFYKDWKEKEQYLPYIDFLKTDAAEAEFLTGRSNTREAATVLYQWGAKEIIITHHSEVLAYDGFTFCHYPLKSKNLSGRTGRGDTCFSAYLSERLNKDIDHSLLFAVALTSIKLANPGPFRGSREEVESFMKKNY
jgi:sugar/nucleoside kinase (ribokinase family)